MLIRGYQLKDIETAREIFDRYYSKDSQGDLEFCDPLKKGNNYLCAFTVEDDNGIIITTGGVRTIAEVTLITDKGRSVRDRVKALKEVLKASSYIAHTFKFDWLHAVTDDPTWANQLKANGFTSRGEDLEIHVGDIK